MCADTPPSMKRFLRARLTRRLKSLFASLEAFNTGVMPMRPPHAETRWRPFAIFVLGITFVWCLLLAPQYSEFFTNTDIDHFSFESADASTALIFPNDFAPLWARHPHLVAIGIPMTNDDNSLRVRGYQMKTWGTFKDVARLSNDFEGLVLPLYLACAVHKWPPYWDASTKAAADRDGDVIIFRLVERQSTTGKALGNGAGRGAGYGAPAMVTNARKISLWFRYAYDHLPYTPFLAKADLDVYINVPAYLTILQQLPRVSTLFGKSRPFRRLFCHGDDVMLYLLGPLYTHTRDVAKEVFSESHVSRRVSDPYSRCYLKEYKELRLRNEDTVHSQTLFRRYAGNATERVFPAQELRDAVLGAPRLPAVSGLGKLYMDYITDALTTVPLSGRVDGLEGYKYKYSLPGPLNRTHLIFVVDNCRNGDEFEVAPNHYGVFSHRSSRWDLFEAHHRKHNVEGGTFHMMQHPSDLVVKEGAHFYYRVDLSDINCEYRVGAAIHDNVDWRECWHGEMPTP